MIITEEPHVRSLSGALNFNGWNLILRLPTWDPWNWTSDEGKILNSVRQEVLGRTNRLFSLIWHRAHWKQRVQQFFYCYVFVTVVTFLPSRCLATIGGFLPSHCLATIRAILPSRCLATIGGDTHTHRQQRNLISFLLFFQNKESRLKRGTSTFKQHTWPVTSLWYRGPEEIFFYPHTPSWCGTKPF
jgi:hypothetical protein